MTEATTCPEFCSYLGEGRLCEVACGHGSPVCPYDDHAMVRAIAALGEIRKCGWKKLGKYKKERSLA